ncbi:hypothetical protein ACXR0O_01980 [Verrucomicrobiota bacterium sgz303538]
MAVKMIGVVAVGVGATLLAKRRQKRGQQQGSNAAHEDNTPFPVPSGHSYNQDDIALRAYFISQRREAAGYPPAPHQDWLDAENELQAELQRRPIEPESP